jgi:hypothetical protein
MEVWAFDRLEISWNNFGGSCSLLDFEARFVKGKLI